MKIKNEMKVTFLSKGENEAFARTAAVAFFSAANPVVSDLADIKTAVSEAVTNSIVHGYRGSFGKVELTARLYENGCAYIKVRDWGCGIPDVTLAMTPMYTTAQSEERAGLGFSVMESFMDVVKVQSKPSKGTSVVMQKKLQSNVEFR